MVKNVLYVHGFNGNPKGGTYEGLVEFFKDKPEYQVISFSFPKLHTDVNETQKQIEALVDKYDVKLLIGASLGGFYTLCCERPVRKIVINPCMLPSVEIPLLKDRETGCSIHIEENVLQEWKALEKYELKDEYKRAVGIFGKQDTTFHYGENHNFKPLFENKRFGLSLETDGKHSLEVNEIVKIMKYALFSSGEIKKFSGRIENLRIRKMPDSELWETEESFCQFWIDDVEFLVVPYVYEKYKTIFREDSCIEFYADSGTVNKKMYSFVSSI